MPTYRCRLVIRYAVNLEADFAVKIAKVLNVSVEYLICGDDAKVVPKEYSRFHPFRSILEDLSVLSDDSIEKHQIMIHALPKTRNKFPASKYVKTMKLLKDAIDQLEHEG